MRIKKFNESEISDISTDRVLEIIKTLADMSTDLEQKSESIDSLLNELGNFRSGYKGKNDQIDDSISNLEFVRKYLSDSLDKIDNVVQNMKGYNQDGRKYLY